MFFSKFKSIYKFPDSLNSCKNGILSSEGMFSKEDFKSGLIFMLICFKVSEGASKLIKIVEQEINVTALFFFHVK